MFVRPLHNLASGRGVLRSSVLLLAIAQFGMTTLAAELPSPILNTVFPAGGRVGTAVDVVVEGIAQEGLTALRFGEPGIASTLVKNQFTVTIHAGTPTGLYDVRTVGAHGVSSPRTYFVSDRPELLESEPNDALDAPGEAVLNAVVNGRIGKPGDIDCYRFAAKAGERVVLECWAERIDAPLRAVLELFDAGGKRLATNRGYVGVDPLIDFRVPADGMYTVKVFDLTFAGGPTSVYRLDIDAGPRVEFAVPSVVERGKTTRVTLFGRNLAQRSADGTSYDRVELDVTPTADSPEPRGLRLPSCQWGSGVFACRVPGVEMPVALAVTEVPVVPGAVDNHSPGNPQPLPYPCEVSGQLAEGAEQDWYTIEARRGEVLWLEAFGERIGAPVDLDLVVLDAAADKELLHLGDCVENIGGPRFPTRHLDPAGRWVVPADGRYLVLLRNVTGGVNHDERRVYRLSVRREEPDFHLVALPYRANQPASLNVRRGGREILEVLALRRRGFDGAIRMTAENLPPGIECSETWIGPGVDRAPLVISASRECALVVGSLKLRGVADLGAGDLARSVAGGTVVAMGQPETEGRLTNDVPLVAFGTAPILVHGAALQETGMRNTAAHETAAEASVDQDSVLDLLVELERHYEGHSAVVNLSLIGLPATAEPIVSTIPAGANQGWISLPVAGTLAPGTYTVVVRVETEVPLSAVTPGAKGNGSVTLFSNAITIRVNPAHISLAVDPRAPKKIARGKIIQLGFSAERKAGFIGKVHTELVAPGGVVGLRGRGVTLVGGSESGTIQIIATDDAPLGRQPFLRLQAVGTVEDRPVYRACRFLELEITE